MRAIELVAFLAAAVAGSGVGLSCGGGLSSRRGPAPHLRIEVVHHEESDDAEEGRSEDLDERVEQRTSGRHAGGDAREQVAVHADPTEELAALHATHSNIM